VIYSDSDCSTMSSSYAATTTCTSGDQLISCTPHPFNFGTEEEIIADTYETFVRFLSISRFYFYYNFLFTVITKTVPAPQTSLKPLVMWINNALLTVLIRGNMTGLTTTSSLVPQPVIRSQQELLIWKPSPVAWI
jgi:hypothetical protein